MHSYLSSLVHLHITSSTRENMPEDLRYPSYTVIRHIMRMTGSSSRLRCALRSSPMILPQAVEYGPWILYRFWSTSHHGCLGPVSRRRRRYGIWCWRNLQRIHFRRQRPRSWVDPFRLGMLTVLILHLAEKWNNPSLFLLKPALKRRVPYCCWWRRSQILRKFNVCSQRGYGLFYSVHETAAFWFKSVSRRWLLLLNFSLLWCSIREC